MDDFASVLRKGLAGAGKGTVLLTAGLIAGLMYAIGLLNNAGIATNDTTSLLFWAFVSFLPLIVVPFVLGGALGYALEASQGGNPGWPTFFASARRHYFGLFIAGIAILIITTLLGYPAAFLILAGAGDVSLLCLAELLTLVAMFIVLMYLEFYDVAIVAESRDGLQGLKASIAFVGKHVRFVLLFFFIVLFAKFFIQLPMLAAEGLRTAAEFSANYSLYFNDTASGTLNSSYFNATMAVQAAPFSAPSLIAIAVLQILVQTIVFAFVISFKVEFYRWMMSIKTAKKITDFDYDFSDEKEV